MTRTELDRLYAEANRAYVISLAANEAYFAAELDYALGVIEADDRARGQTLRAAYATLPGLGFVIREQADSNAVQLREQLRMYIREVAGHLEMVEGKAEPLHRRGLSFPFLPGRFGV